MTSERKWAAAQSIQDELERHGYEAVIVGGAVRDLLLGRDPGDVDVATEAEPQIVKQIFQKTADVGIEHGTVMVLHPDHPVEVTTYRTESSYSDHRRPDEVHFVKSLKEDLKRRDFTMNALAINSDGHVMDYFSGKEDIHHQIIRCVGNPEERFSEDALRMLRAVRFAAQLNFDIENETLRAIRKLAQSITFIAVERIKVELDKIFLSKYPEIGMRLLKETSLTLHFPVLNSDRVNENLQHWRHFNALGNSAYGWAFVNLISGCKRTEDLVRGYKLSNAEKRTIQAIANAVQIRQQSFWSPMNYYHFSKETIRAAEFFTSILNPSIQRMPDEILLEGYRNLPIQSRSEIVVNGNDLIGWSGQRGGPWVKQWLNRLEESIVLKEVQNDREEIRDWFQREFINK
ncbi:CCA tRNA nucleotidyltransferase [Chungangia koreensis]|uniref:CCA-adding enzyme n=1 Tax=Chungangia koreensis TaxID=752657 RepID=A0ABV8X4T6_9LACT